MNYKRMEFFQAVTGYGSLDIDYVIELCDDLDIDICDAVEEARACWGTIDDINSIIYSVYNLAIAKAMLDHDEFEIHCNSIASSLYHIPTDTNITSWCELECIRDTEE